MFGVEAPPPRPHNELHCSFCGWYRMTNPQKGAPPFDEEAALDELVAHLGEAHDQRFADLVMRFVVAQPSTIVVEHVVPTDV